MSLIKRIQMRTVVGLVAVGMVVGATGARAATSTSTDAWRSSQAVHTVVSQIVAIEQSPEFAAFAAAHPTFTANQFAMTGDLRVDAVSTRFNDVLASSAWTTTVDALRSKLTTASPTDLAQALADINRGNAQMLATVGVWTVLVIPGILSCQIGNPGCVELWLLVGAGLSVVSTEAAAFDYLAAVLDLV